MSQAVNLKRLIYNYQEGPVSCIPASVELILNYHKPNFPLNQFLITTLMINYSINNSPSFNAIERIACPALTTFFNIKVLNPSTFTCWLQNIEDELKNDHPVAISTKVPNGSHIRVVLSKDDTRKTLLLYNPGFYLKKSYVFNNNNPTGLIAISEAGLEEYSFNNAQSDFYAIEHCRDQLQIIPV